MIVSIHMHSENPRTWMKDLRPEDTCVSLVPPCACLLEACCGGSAGLFGMCVF